MLPGHSYVGPGTSNFNAQPVDADDRHAELHDRAYSAAKSSAEIRHADADFIDANIADPGPHSLLSIAGIGLKTLAERVSGRILYPALMPSAAKRPHSDITDTQQQPVNSPADSGIGDSVSGGDDAMINPQPGSSLPGGTGASVAGAVTINAPHQQSSHVTFRKRWQVYTGGFQFQQTSGVVATTDPLYGWTSVYPFAPAAVQVLNTPLAVIDPNQPQWFLTTAEFYSLATWARAKRCRVKVVPLGYRLPFATNEASSSFANSQTLVQIAYAVGLNRKTNGIATGYTTDPADLTKPTGIVNGFPNGQAFWYGNAPSSLGCNIGIPRHLNWYWSTIWSPPPKIASDDSDTSTPNFLEHIHIVNVNDVKGTPVIDFQYDYVEGLLRWPQSSSNKFQGGFVVKPSDVAFAMGSGCKRQFLNGAVLDDRATNFLVDAPPYRTHTSNSSMEAQPTYTNFIEKAEYFRSQRTNPKDPLCVPHVNIGCMPVQSNAALSPTPTFASVVVQWEITCELDVEQFYDYALPQANLPWPSTFDCLITDSIGLGSSYTHSLNSTGYVVGRRYAYGNPHTVFGPPGDPSIITALQSNLWNGTPFLGTAKKASSAGKDNVQQEESDTAMDIGPPGGLVRAGGGNATPGSTGPRYRGVADTATSYKSGGRKP